MIRTPIALLALLAIALPAAANDAKDLAPTGTLRATYIATNPVQAFVDPTTKEVRGPAAEIARELGKRAGVPVTVTGAHGVQGVIDSVQNRAADIGFVAFDPMRADAGRFLADLFAGAEQLRGARSSRSDPWPTWTAPACASASARAMPAIYFLTRTLKNAELKRNEGGIGDATVKLLLAGELDAYAGNRMRLHDAVQKTPGLRLVPDNFYGVEQAVIVPKGETARLAIINRFIDEARASGLDRRLRSRAPDSSESMSRRAGSRTPEMKAGPRRSTIPQSCFLQRAGATIAHHRMHMHCAMRGCVGQVTNV